MKKNHEIMQNPGLLHKRKLTFPRQPLLCCICFSFNMESKSKHCDQPNANKGNQNINWITGNIRQLDPESDLVTYDESERRLMIGGICMMCLFIAISSTLTFEFCKLVKQNDVKMVQKLSPAGGRTVPVMPQILKVLKNGQVFRMDFNEGKSAETLLLQLPQTPSKYYFASAADHSTIQFIRDDLLIDVIQYQPFWNKHQTLPKSKVEGGILNDYEREDNQHRIWQYMKSVQFNGKSWFFSMDSRVHPASNLFGATNSDPRTMLWYSKKGAWSNGPDLLKSMLATFPNINSFCTVVLDRNSILFIGSDGMAKP